MNYIDIVICLFLLFGLFKGFMDGFLVSLASLVGLIIGIYAAIHFSHYAADFLADYVSWSEQKINLAAFALTFIGVVILIYFAGKMLTHIANFVALGIVNKLLGAAFGSLRSAFILSVIFLILNEVNLVENITDEETMETSVLYKPVESIAPTILPNILKETKENGFFNSGKEETTTEFL